MIGLVQFSTGAGSAFVAYRAMEEYEEVHLISANTKVEDKDNWRFAREVWMDLGRPKWTLLADGRTPMQVGRDMRVVPNNRMAVCSRVLKRDLIRSHLDATYDPTNVMILLGFDWTEEHRLARSVEPWQPYAIDAPLMRPPYMDKATILAWFRGRGIEPPALYGQGFSHANCGGACVRGGQAQWRLLLEQNRPRYLEWEAEEEETRELLGKDVAILRDRRGGQTKPLPLKAFRLQLEVRPDDYIVDEWGACGCFVGEDGTDER